jgi:hypothetical protein
MAILKAKWILSAKNVQLSAKLVFKMQQIA